MVDVKRYWSGKPFLFAGMNSVFMYFGHQLANRKFLFGYLGGTHFDALLSDTWGVGMWILVAYYFYKKKVFFSV